MIKKSWWVDFRAGPARYRKRSPENSRAGALAYEALLRQQLSRGVSVAEVENQRRHNTPFAQFAWERYKTYVVPNNKFSEQYAKHNILKSSLVPHFGEMTLNSIGTNHIEQFKARALNDGVKNKTINNRLAVLAKCLRCANDWYGITVPKIQMLKCPPPETDYLTPAECDSLLSNTEGQLREMILVGLRTGMRQGEIRGLQWSSIDWHNQTLRVRHSLCSRSRLLTSPKSNRERRIPLDVDLYEVLFRRRRNAGYVFLNPFREAPFTAHRLEEDLRIACKAANIRNVGWHGLRHTFATQISLTRTPITVLKELLGHSSITTTMRYSHVPSAALREAITLLNPRNAGIADFGQPVGNQEPLVSKTGLQR
jgi:integrase